MSDYPLSKKIDVTLDNMVIQEMYIELVYKGHDTRWPFVDSVVSDKLTNYVYAAYRPPKTDLLNHRFPKYGDIEMGKYDI